MKKSHKILVLFIVFAALLSGCIGYTYFKNKKKIQDYYIGVYILNYARSDFNKSYSDSSKYYDLELEMKKDGTFQFSREVPFIYSSSGEWEIEIGSYYNNCNLYYSKSDLYDQLLKDLNNSVYIKYPRAKSNEPYVNMLSFDKRR